MHRGSHLGGQKEGTISGVTCLLIVMVRRYLVERCTQLVCTCVMQYIFPAFLILVSGQGCKVCPYADTVEAQKPHENVTREDLKLRVAQQQWPYGTSAQQALFEKTL